VKLGALPNQWQLSFQQKLQTPKKGGRMPVRPEDRRSNP
jgi:hypothetical protein